MTPSHPANGNDASAPRLALLYGGLFLALGVQMPFLPVWLAAKGLDPRAIGLLLGAAMVVRLAAVPVVTRAADRRLGVRAALVGCAWATVAGYTVAAFCNGFWPILVVLALASAAYTPMLPLADAYALKGLVRRGRAYGPVRLWGSAAFIIGSLGAGVLAEWIASRDLIWLMVATFVATALAAGLLGPLAADRASGAALPPVSLLRSPSLLAVAVAASLIQASHAVLYGFGTLAWAAIGLDGRTIGILWALGVIAEIVLFALSGRLPPWLGPLTLIALGAGGAAIRWAAMAFDPPVLVLPLLQVLHGLSFGATHLGMVQFIAKAVPDRVGATMQGHFSVLNGAVMAGAMGLSGVLYGTYGHLAYAPMAAAALLGGGLAVAAGLMRR